MTLHDAVESVDNRRRRACRIVQGLQEDIGGEWLDRRTVGVTVSFALRGRAPRLYEGAVRRRLVPLTGSHFKVGVLTRTRFPMSS